MPRFEDGLSVGKVSQSNQTLTDLANELTELAVTAESLACALEEKMYGESGETCANIGFSGVSVYSTLMTAKSRLKTLCEKLDGLNDRTL